LIDSIFIIVVHQIRVISITVSQEVDGMSNTSSLNSELVLLDADASEVTIRDAAGDDLRALQRLAQLDSARLPEFPIVVAESGGELRAAYSITEERAIADPFHRTAELVELLELHAGRHLDGVNGGPTTPARRQLPTEVTRAARA
jgi:hypothetical protein